MHPMLPACTPPACTIRGPPTAPALPTNPCAGGAAVGRGVQVSHSTHVPPPLRHVRPRTAAALLQLMPEATARLCRLHSMLPARSVRPTLNRGSDCCTLKLKHDHSLQRSDTVSWRCSTQLHGRRCCTQGWAGLRHVAAAARPSLARRVEAYALQLVRAAGCGGHIVRLPSQELALSNGW